MSIKVRQSEGLRLDMFCFVNPKLKEIHFDILQKREMQEISIFKKADKHITAIMHWEWLTINLLPIKLHIISCLIE